MLALLWLALIWAAVHLTCRLVARRLPADTTLTLSALSVHLSTTALNALPARILALTGGSHWKSEGRRWRQLWDAGALVCVAGVVVGQCVLLWAAWRALGAVGARWTARRLAREAALAAAELAKQPVKLARRSLSEAVGDDGGDDGLLLHALVGTHSRSARIPLPAQKAVALTLIPLAQIPGITTPLSSLLPLFLSLLTAQALHELGHALAAASESIAVLATGIHLHFLVPTAYVALPPTLAASHGALTELRVATAGVASNLVLCAAVWGALRAGSVGAVRSVWGTEVEGGVKVVEVDRQSALYWHLEPGSVITNLDDLELDATAHALPSFDSYLSAPPTNAQSTYSSLGWCLPTSDFTAAAEACCLPHESIANLTAPRASTDHLLCFNSPAHTRTACLSPIPIFDPAAVRHPPSRCLDSSTCEDGRGCAWLKEGDRVLRMHVRTGEGATAREGLVVWEGDKRAVRRQVTVTDRVPRLFLVPYWAPHALAKAAAAVADLSLTVAFLNLLPLPSLDGAAILAALRAAIQGGNSKSPLHAIEAGVDLSEDGLLASAVGALRRSGAVQGWVACGERGERWAQRWTMAWGVVLLVASGVAGLLSKK